MAVKKTPPGKPVSKEVLTKELSILGGELHAKIDSVEKRLDTKIEDTSQSLKEYVDSRISQVRGDVQGVKDDVQQVQTGLQQLSEKLDRKVEGIVQLIEGSTGRQVEMEERLGNHERRITTLEQKGS